MSDEHHQFNAEEVSLLYRVARTLLRERDFGELLSDLLDDVIDCFGADRGFVILKEGENYGAVAARNFRSEALSEAEEEVSSSISRAVLDEGRTLLLGDAQEEEFGRNPSVRRMGLRSLLCAPLVADKNAFAMVYLENREVSNRFTDAHRRLLDEICALSAPRLRVAVAVEQARRRARELDAGLGEADGILTADPEVGKLLETVRQVAPTELPVLIQGETGTGKELVARSLYRQSNRSASPFVVVNCAALPPGLIESELFGSVRGAYTGANRDRVGLVGAAHRGTLFLDEIGELPLELQPRLLRVLQSGEFNRVGSVKTETADVRAIAATNRDLVSEVEAGRFRDDLYFRLSGITLKVPPLRSRPHDIRLLADHFLSGYASRYGRTKPQLSSDCLATLCSYSFPGNVRELESEMARLVAVSTPGEALGPEVLNERVRGVGPDSKGLRLEPMSLAEMERRLIQIVLTNADGNRTKTAEILGISREGLRTKMKRLGIAGN